MAKKSVIERQKKREKIVNKFSQKRKLIKNQLNSLSITEQEKWDLRLQLQSLPRNANPVRLRNRCFITGRPRGYYRNFGLCRIKLRELGSQGYIPGFVKSTW